MAGSMSARFLHFFIAAKLAAAASVVDDLNNLKPPPEFNSTVANNCRRNPSLRYCGATPNFDVQEIFKFSIVASHLCNVSRNPNCVEDFPKIDLQSEPKLAPLYLSFAFFWKYCPLTVLSIDLSNCSLAGEFPTEIFYCSQIKDLDLSFNRLSGDVPVRNFSSLKNLTFLNLSYNGFSECKISEVRFLERFNSSSFINSGIIPDRGKFRIKALAVGFGVAVLVVAIVGILCCSGRGCSTSEYEFRPSVLDAATEGFSRRNLVGKTGRRSVYKGVMRDGKQVRIEVCLGDEMTKSKRERLVEEAKILVQLKHRNIVPVIGWCDSSRLMAIVSEWRGKLDVETWLGTRDPPWRQRLRIISGVGSGVCYLHREWPQLGFDLRTRHVVLSEEEEGGVREPLITWLRLNLNLNQNQNQNHHRHRRRHGCSWKSDKHKLGVFLLEMVTNRRPTEELENNKDGGSVGFVEWVRSHCPGKLELVIDRRMGLKKMDDVCDAVGVIQLGLMCMEPSTRRQPTWDQIHHMLSEMDCRR
ncbi:brassinosteroid LRR receptor kinase [Andrographis paniculata]|uniref:brassinosteroid LRR receptor kinase n=1 Tax=Andrographis paniculata TaxID=175694 RepID=UPI0021E74383|nr:brassinosteroid LRR receptor kinase [Andrographis paniculata]